MGTIAEKLTYLNTTKIKLRDSLNKFGSSILSTDTFRSYDTKLNEIYDKLPKITQSGTGFTLLDVQNGQVDDFKMIGTDIEQDTTTGKQLFDINSEMNTNSLIDAGITSTFNEDGTITVNGEKNANYKYIRYSVTLPAGTYYFCGCPSGGSNSSYSSLVQLTQDVSSQIFDTGNGGTFTLTEQTTIQYFPVRVGSASLTFNNTIFRPMISTSPVTYDDFEKYTGGIPSPNPDYPQEIKVVEGRQVVTDKGKNLFDKNNATKGYYYSSTAIEESANWYIYQAPVKANTNYYLSGNNYSNVYARIWLLDESKNRISTIGDYKNTHLITTTDNTTYIGLSIADYNGTADMDTLQLEENSSATDYEPYHDPVDYNIDLTNDLLKYNKCDFTPTTTSWYFLDSSGSAYGSDIGTKTNIKFPVEQNKVYTFRYNVFVEPLMFQLCYENEDIIGTITKTTGNQTFTFTSNRNGYVIPRVRVNASSQIKITDISVVKGEEDYYDYKLAKMPNTDYKNRIYKSNGNWYYEENPKKVILDGSENWYYVNNSSYSESIIRYRCDDFTDVLSTGYGAFILSSNFKGFPLGHRTENGIARQLDSSGLNIFIDKSITNNSLTNFKNWLSTNNVEVWYPLVNPVTTQITNTTLIDQLEAISVHTGTNIITLSSDNDMIPEIEITRLKELERLS